MDPRLWLVHAVRRSLALPPEFGDPWTRFQFDVGWQIRNKAFGRVEGPEPTLSTHPDAGKAFEELLNDPAKADIVAFIEAMATAKLMWMIRIGSDSLKALREAGYSWTADADPGAFIEHELLERANRMHHSAWLWARQICILCGVSVREHPTAAEHHLLTFQQIRADDAQIASDYE